MMGTQHSALQYFEGTRVPRHQAQLTKSQEKPDSCIEVGTLEAGPQVFNKSWGSASYLQKNHGGPDVLESV